MHPTERPASEIVTDHCALWYLERALDVDIGTIKPAGETQRLAFLCKGLGITVEALKTSIASPTVRAAIALGSRKVLSGGIWFTIMAGRITTVLNPQQRNLRTLGYGNARRQRGPRKGQSPQIPARNRAFRDEVGDLESEGL